MESEGEEQEADGGAMSVLEQLELQHRLDQQRVQAIKQTVKSLGNVHIS